MERLALQKVSIAFMTFVWKIAVMTDCCEQLYPFCANLSNKHAVKG